MADTVDCSNANLLLTEIEFYKQNQATMEEEIRAVINDNQKLSEQLSEVLRERTQVPYMAQGDTGEVGTELRAQLSLLTKERDSLFVLWQTAQTTINVLENELKIYNNCYNAGQHAPFHMASNSKEDKGSINLKFETALNDYLELEQKLKSFQMQYTTLEQRLKAKENKITELTDKAKETENKIKDLEKSLEDHKIDLAAEKKKNEHLQEELKICHKEISSLIKREAEAKSKVAEGLQLYDLVCSQKIAAVQKNSTLIEELTAVKKELSSAKQDGEKRFRNKLDELKTKYNDKVADMLLHIRNLDAELVQKGELLREKTREVQNLREENECYARKDKECLEAIDPKLKLAERRVEAMFKELVTSESRNMQINSEKQSLALQIQRLQEAHEREIKRRDWEEQLLKTQYDDQKVQLEHFQTSLADTHAMINKLQDMLVARTEFGDKIVAAKEEELKELNKHLENQMELNKKWKQSYLEMTETLKTKILQMEKENNELRAQLDIPYLNQSDTSGS